MGYQRRVHGESISLHQSSENSRSKMSQIARIAISNCNRSVLAGWQRPVVAMSQQTSRALTTTTVNKDIDSAAKFIGAVPPPLVSQDQEQVLDPSSVPSSSVMPVTHPSNNNSSPTPFWDSPFPKPWVFSVL